MWLIVLTPMAAARDIRSAQFSSPELCLITHMITMPCTRVVSVRHCGCTSSVHRANMPLSRAMVVGWCRKDASFLISSPFLAQPLNPFDLALAGSEPRRILGSYYPEKRGCCYCSFGEE